MSWHVTDAIDERLSFMAEWHGGGWRLAELCRRYGVSRKAGYRLIGRFAAEGVDGLKDRSHARHHHPNATSAGALEAVLGARAEHPHWGPKKLKAWLERRAAGLAAPGVPAPGLVMPGLVMPGLVMPGLVVPAASTIGLILQRHGLTVRRRPRGRAVPSAGLSASDAANDVWAMDFKGWFRTGDGTRCDPLSLSDLGSRYLLRVQALDRPDAAHVWPVLDAAFREFGLPRAMRSDNGPPFASSGAGGLSTLAVQLIKAGVVPERIRPGKPQENGRHERMHRTLKQETASPPAASIAAQQRRFDAFRQEFNHERPHEALDQQTPADRFCASPRQYSGRLRSPEPDGADQVRKVRSNGEIRWAGQHVFISEALIGEPVGLIERDDGRHDILYGPILLGQLSHQGAFTKAKATHNKPPADVTHQPG